MPRPPNRHPSDSGRPLGSVAAMLTVLTGDEIERVLVVMAHPDDVDFGAAGTVRAWTDSGVVVTYCLVTDGDAGGFDDTIPRPEMARIRRREQTAAAELVGVKDLVFLGRPDGRVVADLDLRCDLSRVIRQVRPQVVLCQSAQRNYGRIYASHPDHLAAGEAAISAVYPDSRNPFAFTELLDVEGLAPWSVVETWVAGHADTNHAVDITEHVDVKMAALRAHESQHRDPDGMEERVRTWNRMQGEAAGFGSNSYAEVFLVLDTR
jgi:LmbE family N-acetylglucosaminyl deacetylase